MSESPTKSPTESPNESTIRPPPKSPPIAFQTTSNDALWAPMSQYTSNASSSSMTSPPPGNHMFDTHVSESELEMQNQIDKQAEALRLQNQAFVAERESWQMEKDRLYRRIASLEALLKGTANGHSPARSPVVSPRSGNICAIPHLRSHSSLGSTRLASIAEDENTSPFGKNRRQLPSLKRDSAPNFISIPSIIAPNGVNVSNRSLDSTLEAAMTPDNDLMCQGTRSPPQTRVALSPLPPANVHHAGHTPLRASISGDMSPTRSNFSGHLDTPTRGNTDLNKAMNEVDSDDEQDRPLKGPLMLPELPHDADSGNFTMQMLNAKLQDLVEHPEDSEPMVLKTPERSLREEGFLDELCVIDDQVVSQPESTKSNQASDSASKLESPKGTSPEAVRKEDPFGGGIKLRKKASSNFGAPLGQLNPMWKH